MNKQELIKLIGEPKSDEYYKDGMYYCKNCNGERLYICDFWNENMGKVGLKPITRSTCKCQQEEQEKLSNKAISDLKAKQKAVTIKKLKELSEIGAKYKDARFENSKIRMQELKGKELEKFKNHYKNCFDYCANAKSNLICGKGLYLYGKYGTGKTHLTACMCNFLIDNQYSCILTSLDGMCSNIRKTYNKESKETEDILIDRYTTECDFLFIDDFGNESFIENPFYHKMLDKIINLRYINNLPTIFSSNIDLIERSKVNKADLYLKVELGLKGRIFERIYEMVGQNRYEFTNKSFRV